MSLRVRLALALLLLSALPLAGFAWYSFSTSSQALRRAAEAEAELLARDLALRVGATASEVDRRVRALARLPIEAWGGPASADDTRLEAALAGLGPAARYIEGISFVPGPAPPVPAVPGMPAAARVAPVAPVAPAGAVPPVAAAPPAPPPGVADGVARGRRAADEGGRQAERTRRLLAEEQLRLAADVRERDALRSELERVRAAIARSLEQQHQAHRAGVVGGDLTAALEIQKQVMKELDAAGVPPAPPAAAPPGAPAPPAGPASAAAPTPAPAPPASPIGGSVSCPVAAGDHVVGALTARIKARELLHSVLAQTDRAQGEIPFAIDGERQLYVAREEDAARLENLPAIRELRAGGLATAETAEGDWVVVARRDAGSGFLYGIARPLSTAMADLRRATARNFSFGMLLVGLALVGLVPVSGRLVRDVRRLEEGASRLAAGDLEARVEVSSRHELGRLAATFNRMAGQIAEHQEKLLEQERLRKEEEIARRLLEAENERRRRELDEAREFQLSLLPRELPRRPELDLAVSMTTATEVGGDYYDFLDGEDGALVVAVGDATGHGAAAGTLVTAIKGLFAGSAASAPPAAFLAAANAAVHRMGLVRRAMALAVARVRGARVTLSAAGMPPALHFRVASGEVREVALPGTPLGARAGFPYAEAEIELAKGDALLFLSDGLPELPNAQGEPFGYERLARRFGELGRREAGAIVAGLEASAAEWSGGGAPADDVTFLVLKSV